MEQISIRLDQNSLPCDGERITWQTQNDFNNEVWKEGIFDKEENMFCVGFDEIVSEWNYAFDVLHWVKII